MRSGQAVNKDGNYLGSRTRRAEDERCLKDVFFRSEIKMRGRLDGERYSPKLMGYEEGSGSLYRQVLLISKLKLQDKKSSRPKDSEVRRRLHRGAKGERISMIDELKS